MNNEPVAWTNGVDIYLDRHCEPTYKRYAMPLYTHPADLAEQDLDKLVKDAEDGGYMDMYITGLIDGFNHARAILKKAQEK